MNSLFHVTMYNLQHYPRQLNVRNAEESGRRQARHQCRDDAIVDVYVYRRHGDAIAETTMLCALVIECLSNCANIEA